MCLWPELQSDFFAFPVAAHLTTRSLPAFLGTLRLIGMQCAGLVRSSALRSRAIAANAAIGEYRAEIGDYPELQPFVEIQ